MSSASTLIYVFLFFVYFIIGFNFIRFRYNNSKLRFHILLVFLLVFLIISLQLVEEIGISVFMMHFAGIQTQSLLILLPLSYLLLSKKVRNTIISGRDLFHFIPAFLFFVNNWDLYFLAASQKAELIINSTASFDFLYGGDGWLFPKQVGIGMIYFQFLIYVCLHYLLKRGLIKQAVVLPGISRVISGLIFLFTGFLILGIVSFLLQFSLLFFVDLNFLLLVFFGVYLIFFPNVIFVYRGFLGGSSEIYSFEKSVDEIAPDEQKDQSSNHEVYDVNGMKTLKVFEVSALIDEKISAIERYFLLEEPFLDSKFSTSDCENKLGFSRKSISSALNKKYGLNFSKYVNYWRIKYLLDKKQTDPKYSNYSNDALSELVGFGSKNSFYTYFKEFTGMCPREFFEKDDFLRSVQKK